MRLWVVLLPSLAAGVIVYASLMTWRFTVTATTASSEALRQLTRLARLVGTVVLLWGLYGMLMVVLRHTTLLPAAAAEPLLQAGGIAIVAFALAVGLATIRPVRTLVREVERSEQLLTALTGQLPSAIADASVLEGVQLTAREREVVDLIGSGVVSDADLAATLHISPTTAATHVRNILRKSSLRSRRELALVGNELLAGGAQ